MMSNVLIVKEPLDQARRDLAEATEKLTLNPEPYTPAALAASALLHAIANIWEAVERLSELPACDGSHE